MKAKNYLWLLLIVFASCGPSAEEKAKIEAETIARIAREKYEKVKANNLYTIKREFEHKLTDAKIELELANDALNKIEEFQFLRTYEEKEQQKRNQMHNIANMEKQISNLEDVLSNITPEISDIEYEGLVKVMEENGIAMEKWQ